MSFWKQRNVFVTGATGLLGSWLTEELLAQGANVICLVRDWVPRSRLIYSDVISKVTVVRGELEDHALLTRVLNECEIDTVFHLGAQTIVGTAARSALSTFEANIRGTWNLLEACKLNAKLIRRVVVASSDKAYGAHDHLPYKENAPLQGRFPYDVSKSCTDLISLSYFHTYGTPVAITRCGNLYGGGDLNFSRLIPGTIRSVINGESPIIRSDGTFVRDYFFVKDAVGAYLRLAEQMPREGITGQAFNFASDAPRSVIELVETILQVMDRPDLKPLVLNEASNEIPKQFLDASFARNTLGWQPGYRLEQGLAETISWYRQFLETTGQASPRSLVNAHSQ